MRIPWYCGLTLLLCTTAGPALAGTTKPATAPYEPVAAGARLGFLVDTEAIAGMPEAGGHDRRPLSQVALDWQLVERDRGVYDWSFYDRIVGELTDAGYEVVLAIGGSSPHHLPDGGLPSPAIGDSLNAWVALVRATVRRYGDRVIHFQVGWRAGEDPGLDPRLEALVIKQAALAVRSEAEARGRDYRVVQPAVAAGDLDRQRGLWAQDLAAYVDVVPLMLDGPGGAGVRELLAESLLHPPAADVWGYADGEDPGEAAAWATSALANGAEAAWIRAPIEPGESASLAAWVGSLDTRLARGFAPAPSGRLRLECEGGEILARFFNETGFESLVVYRTAETGGPPACRLLVEAAVVRDARIPDPRTGQAKRIGVGSTPEGLRTLELPRSTAPSMVLYRQGAGGVVPSLPLEEIAVASTRGLTAEEVIARHQAMRREQENRLERFTSLGRVDYHFRLTQGGSTIDVSMDSRYFWERGGELEWEQLEYYINGNKVNWKKFPRLPLIQPEKVITLPLDLTLDKAYSYRLVGDAVVDGRGAYEIEFQPADRDAALSLYRGRIWIDRERFVRLKLRLIQSNLESPVISNEEIDHFAEFEGPEGGRFSLFSEIYGQQVWNVAGRTFVVQRELTFRDVRINPPLEEFQSLRERAYESDNTMMRDTVEGFRYLDRTPEGDRVVKEKVASSTLFVGAGAFKDASQENVVPLAAVNYFDYDVAGKNLQLNVFFAGVFTFANLSKPDLFGGRMDLTLDLGLSAIDFSDKFFVGKNELIEERVDTRPQRIDVRLGFPFGDFFKLNFIGAANYYQYGLSDAASEAIELYNSDPANAERLAFRVPEDHWELSAAIEARYNRRGYTVVGRTTRSRRSDWDTWGLYDTVTGTPGSVDPVGGTFVPVEPEPAHQTYTKWGIGAFKEWFLPHFQRVRIEASYLDGQDLDRFSRYQFSYFGSDRLNGFSGSGVRFDHGLIGRAGYSFNIMEAIRFDVGVDTARVEELRGGAGGQNFTGLGINGNFPAPWRTVVTVGYGRSLASDIPELEGEQEFLLLILKLF